MWLAVNVDKRYNELQQKLIPPLDYNNTKNCHQLYVPRGKLLMVYYG